MYLFWIQYSLMVLRMNIYILKLKFNDTDPTEMHFLFPFSICILLSPQHQMKKGKKQALPRILINIFQRVQLLVGHKMLFYAHNDITEIAIHCLKPPSH